MNTEETFGNRIKRLRERMGINKAELSRLAGMTRTAMGQYEERDTAAKCTIQHLQSISDVLSVSMEYLVNGQERHATIDEAVLTRALGFVDQLLPAGTPEKKAKLIKFVYGLEAQGVEPTLAIVRGFYQAL